MKSGQKKQIYIIFAACFLWIMKVLILANKMPYPAKDGGSIATLSLAKNLHNCGATVDILAMNTSKHNTSYDELPKELTQQIRFFPIEIDTTIRATKALTNFFFSSQPYNATRFISDDFRKKLIALLQENSYDIIQLEGLYVCPYIPTIRQYSKAKIALRAHNIEHEIWFRAAKNMCNPLKKFYTYNLAKRIRKFEQKYINTYDLLLPITERDGEKFVEMGNSAPMQVVATGINKDNELLKIDNERVLFPSLFHIGALDWMPNQEGLRWFIERVWDKFYKRYPAIFTIAGRNASPQFVHYLKKHNVNYIGEVDDSMQIFGHQSIMIIPILSGSGMRIKIIEGMASGKAIITTTIGTEGIATTHDENILIADTAEEFYNCLENVYNDFHLYMRLSQNAKLFVTKNFDNTVIAQNLIQFYTSHLS